MSISGLTTITDQICLSSLQSALPWILKDSVNGEVKIKHVRDSEVMVNGIKKKDTIVEISSEVIDEGYRP